jgi:DNA replication and repair protein RecF
MHLQELTLINFRNYAEAKLKFNNEVIVFAGPNGSGKTNLLDAVHYLSFCKSFLNPVDSQNIKGAEPFFVIQGTFEHEDRSDSIYCGLKRNFKKQFKRNGKEYERLSEHIGLFPLVVISPADIGLIHDGSEERRRFIDSVISQYDKPYLDNLIKYTKLIQQRNASLRHGQASDDLLDIWDEQLPVYAIPVFEARKLFFERIAPLIDSYYSYISADKERAEIRYESQLHDEDFHALLKRSREKDRIMHYSTSGIHKDDLGMLLNGMPLRKFASQGQQKSFLIALKLAQFDVIRDEKGLKPLLLLDDIFEKLDQQRITALMTLVNKHHFGQLFITDTHPERVAEILNSINCSFDQFLINQGSIITT